jgi:hypothetical protein
MSTINISISGYGNVSFNYNSTRIADNPEVLKFTVKHNLPSLNSTIPPLFEFIYHLRDNVTIGKIEGYEAVIAEKIIEQEGI